MLCDPLFDVFRSERGRVIWSDVEAVPDSLGRFFECGQEDAR